MKLINGPILKNTMREKNHENSTNICDFPNIRERKPKIRSECEIKLKIEFPTLRYKLQSPDASENDITGGERLTPFHGAYAHTHSVYMTTHPSRWVCLLNSRSAREAHGLARARQQHTPPLKVQAKCVRENQSCTEWGGWETRWTFLTFGFCAWGDC